MPELPNFDLDPVVGGGVAIDRFIQSAETVGICLVAALESSVLASESSSFVASAYSYSYVSSYSEIHPIRITTHKCVKIVNRPLHVLRIVILKLDDTLLGFLTQHLDISQLKAEPNPNLIQI